MEHSLSENVFECKYTPYREIRPNHFAFAQEAQARHPSARKSGPNSQDELPINQKTSYVSINVNNNHYSSTYALLSFPQSFFAELSPSLRYTTFFCECFRLACRVYALRVRMRTKHWETAGSLDFSRGIQITRSVWEEAKVFSPLVVLPWRARHHRLPARKESDAAILYSVWWFNAKRVALILGYIFCHWASSLRCVV